MNIEGNNQEERTHEEIHMSARREELENDIDTCRCEIADKRQEIKDFEPGVHSSRG